MTIEKVNLKGVFLKNPNTNPYQINVKGFIKVNFVLIKSRMLYQLSYECGAKIKKFRLPAKEYFLVMNYELLSFFRGTSSFVICNKYYSYHLTFHACPPVC
jgi:hypothetical protein